MTQDTTVPTTAPAQDAEQLTPIQQILACLNDLDILFRAVTGPAAAAPGDPLMGSDPFWALTHKLSDALLPFLKAPDPKPMAAWALGMMHVCVGTALLKTTGRPEKITRDAPVVQAFEAAHACFLCATQIPVDDQGSKLMAIEQLAYLYENGQVDDWKPNLEKAYKLHLVAAKEGWATSQMQLGLLCFEGRGVEKSPLMGYVWMKQALQNQKPLPAQMRSIAAQKLFDYEIAVHESLAPLHRDFPRRETTTAQVSTQAHQGEHFLN